MGGKAKAALKFEDLQRHAAAGEGEAESEDAISVRRHGDRAGGDLHCLGSRSGEGSEPAPDFRAQCGDRRAHLRLAHAFADEDRRLVRCEGGVMSNQTRQSLIHYLQSQVHRDPFVRLAAAALIALHRAALAGV